MCIEIASSIPEFGSAFLDSVKTCRAITEQYQMKIRREIPGTTELEHSSTVD